MTPPNEIARPAVGRGTGRGLESSGGASGADSNLDLTDRQARRIVEVWQHVSLPTARVLARCAFGEARP